MFIEFDLTLKVEMRMKTLNEEMTEYLIETFRGDYNIELNPKTISNLCEELIRQSREGLLSCGIEGGLDSGINTYGGKGLSLIPIEDFPEEDIEYFDETFCEFFNDFDLWYNSITLQGIAGDFIELLQDGYLTNPVEEGLEVDVWVG